MLLISLLAYFLMLCFPSIGLYYNSCVTLYFYSPNLSWRDVQYILVYSSNPRVAQDSNWATNGAGLRFSHKYGFGLIDAAALVNRARHWVNVPERHSCSVTITNDKQLVAHV